MSHTSTQPLEMKKPRVSSDDLKDMRTGPNYGTWQHIRDLVADAAMWSDAEVLMFQYELAQTLCHELVHAFWKWSRRLCELCVPEPYCFRHQMNILHQTRIGGGGGGEHGF